MNKPSSDESNDEKKCPNQLSAEQEKAPLVGAGGDSSSSTSDDDPGAEIETTARSTGFGDTIGGTFSAHAMLVFKEMRERSQLTDVTLEADDGTRLPVHKAIMAACSPYFLAAFTTGFVEKHQDTLKLPSVPGTTLRQIVEFAYARSVHDMNWTNVQDLLTWADFFDIRSLVRHCCQFLVRNLTIRNCLGIFRLARWYEFKDLADEAWSFVAEHFEGVSEKNKDVVHYSAAELAMVLQSDQLNVRSEETIWRVIERWMDHDPQNRQSELDRLAKHVRFGLIESATLDRIRASEYVKASAACREMIGNAYKYVRNFCLMGREVFEMVENKTCEPRQPGQLLLAVGGWSGGAPTGLLEAYDRKAQSWSKLTINDPNGPRAYHGCVVRNRELWTIGGFNGHSYFNSVRKLNLLTKQWSERAPMNHRRCYVSVVQFNDQIWAMGGYDGHHRISTVERYDPKDNQWTLVAPFSVARSDAHASICGDRLYITGGFNGNDCLDSVEYYDAGADRWILIVPMRHRRSGVGCTTLDEVLYVAGGFNGQNRHSCVERYDPRSGRWEELADMSTRRSNFGIEALDGRIVVAGGFNGATTIAECEAYDPRVNAWTPLPSMKVNRSALYCSVVGWLPNMHEYLDCNSRAFPAWSHGEGVRSAW